MTDAQYWSIANGLPKSIVGGNFALDWHSQIPSCPPDPLACIWVRGYNPIDNCWVDPGAQYVNPPSPYPSPSSWGVSICNPPAGTNPPAGGGGGGGTTHNCPVGVWNGSQCVSSTGSGPIPGSNPTGLPALNSTYVLIGLAVLAALMFMRK